jgi:hypothetical protein
MKNFVILLLLLPTLAFGQLKAPQPKKSLDSTEREEKLKTAADFVTEQSRLSAVNNIMSLNTSSQMMFYDANDMNVKGSRFFHENFVEGELWFTDGMHVSKEYLYRFDEVDNTVVLRDKNNNDVVLANQTISGCRMNINGKYVLYFRGETPNSNDKKKIYQLIYSSDNYRLIKLPVKKLMNQQKTFHDDKMAFEYKTAHRFYIKKKSGDYVEISLKKKDIMEALPEQQTTLNQLFEKPAYKGRLNEGSISALLTELEPKN